MTQRKKQTSNRFLIILFAVAVCVFSAFRWDSSAWVSNKVNQAASQAGIDMSYQSLHASSLGVTLKNVVIKTKNKPSITLDEIKVSPSLSALASGVLGVDIEAIWLGNPVSASISQDGSLLHITQINALVDVSRIENLNIPAQLSGLIHATGDITIDQSTGLPQSGVIHTTWNKAMAGLTSPEFTLGDYTIDLNSVEDIAQAWQWKISGGSGVGLNGSGTVFPRSPNLKQWPINGIVDANIDHSNPSLSMMVKSMMGGTQAKLKISGSLGAPRTDIVR